MQMVTSGRRKRQTLRAKVITKLEKKNSKLVGRRVCFFFFFFVLVFDEMSRSKRIWRECWWQGQCVKGKPVGGGSEFGFMNKRKLKE